MYPEEVVEEVRQGNDIVDVIGQYVQLKKRGGNYFGLCPFHREKSPSFSVNADKQMFHCFGCGAGGNVYSFVMRYENYSFTDAIKHLADRIHYTLPESGYSKNYARNKELKDSIYEMNTLAARFFYEKLNSAEGQAASVYLDQRRIAAGARRKFGLGAAGSGRDELFRHLMEQNYSEEMIVMAGLAVEDKRGGYRDKFYNRLMFPIFDPYDKIVGFGGRALGDAQPKYLNSPDTLVFDKSSNLYAINFARRARAEEIIIVEGYMDVISVYQQGFQNVTAALGTAFNQKHANLLKKFTKSAVALFDSDAAGEKAALRAIPILTSAGLNVRALQLEGAKDPDEFIQKYGKDTFAGAVKSAKHHATFRIGCAQKRYNLDDPTQKVQFVREAANIIAELESSVEREVYAKEVAASSGVSEKSIMDMVGLYHNGEADFAPPAYNNRHAATPGKIATRGVDEARRNFLYIMANRDDLCPKLIATVNAEELVEDIYKRLYNLIAKTRQSGGVPIMAEIVSHFEDVKEQNIVSTVFSVSPEYANEEQLRHALNDQIKRIKTAYLDSEQLRLDSSNSDNTISDNEYFAAVQKLAQSRRNLRNSYI